MKKISFALLGVLLIVVVFNSQLGQAKDVYPLNNNSIELNEFSDGEDRKLLINIDENGYFYSEVLEGEDIGSFEAWDGKNFYRYSNDNHLMIVKDPKDGSKVIAHPFLSDVINDRIVEDIAEKVLKKSFLSSEYKKTNITNQQKIVETVKLDKNNQFFQEYKMEVDNEEYMGFEITKVGKLEQNFNIHDYVKLEQLKSNDVVITKVEDELH